ncbi:MAG: TIGR03084 family protein [Rhodobacteraceae bacterium]|nr:TIGR03084 family protein [Paracoccaceae bacterium]
MQQAQDFLNESTALASILEPLTDADFDMPTQFKGWSIDDVIGHLHMFNVAALNSLQDDSAFATFFAPIAASMAAGKTMLQSQYPWLNGLRGRALFEHWRDTVGQVALAYADADPKRRLKWAGPDMSTLSCITARQMETWAHGQEVFDALGQTRIEQDRIRNIAHLGVSTFGWTFINRGLSVPDPAPFVRLTGPSSAVWDWNAPQDENVVQGDAVEFAQVVTQVRNVTDTSLKTVGETAADWMAMAQCFAGPVNDPPAKGTRHIVQP